MKLTEKLGKKINSNKSHNKERNLKMEKSYLKPIWGLSFVFCFMLFIYEPINTYLSNPVDFVYSIKEYLPAVLKLFAVAFIGIGAVLTLICFILKKSKKFTDFPKYIFIAMSYIFFTSYIQGNFLANKLPALTGSSFDISSHKKLVIISSICYLVIGFILFISLKKIDPDKIIKYILNMISIIFIMITASFMVTIFVYINDDSKQISHTKTYDTNFDIYSKNKNFVVFLVDAVASKQFNEIIDSDKKYQDMFSDFTYYTDAMSVYPYTRDSIPLILSGKANKNENAFGEYCSNAYDNSDLFENLKNNDYDINLYEDYLIWSNNKKFDIANTTINHNNYSELKDYTNMQLRYNWFKYAPFVLKKFAKIEYVTFKFSQSESENSNIYSWNNDNLYNKIKNYANVDTKSKNDFKFIHAEGAHVPYAYNENLKKIDNSDYTQSIKASITLVNSYIQRLKDNGLYDNTAIVIMADHGYSGIDSHEKHDILKRFNPIFLVKGFNEKHDLQKSDKPISYYDLQPAFADIINGKKSDELFNDIQAPRTRSLLWYVYTKENNMVEYETDGTSVDIEKFKETGNVYNR